MVIKLDDGYKVEILENRLNDWNVLKLLRNIDKGDSSLIVDVAELMLGEEQSDALAEHLAVDGITTIDSMVDALRQIMESSTAKNS